MNVVFPPDVLARLAKIEREEGVRSVDLVRQAAEVWSYLNCGERRQLMMLAIKLVMDRRLS